MSSENASGDLANAALQKIGDSLRKGIAACDSLLNSISLGATDRKAYKGILLCRMETQYSLALMKYCLKVEPAAGKSRIKVAWPGDLERASHLLQTASSELQSGNYSSSARSLADADKILGHLVAKLRGGKPAARSKSQQAGVNDD